MSRQRPVFVYGTLRPGQPNWQRLLAHRCVRVASGRLPGAVLLDCGHFPAAVERPGPDVVVGDVVWVQTAAWPDVLDALDHLEGYDPADPDPLYGRVVRAVEVAGGRTDCWVYVAGPSLADSGRPVVPGGDWAVHSSHLEGYGECWKAIGDANGRAAAEWPG